MLLSTGIVQPPISQLCAFDSFAQCRTLCLEVGIGPNSRSLFSVFVDVPPLYLFPLVRRLDSYRHTSFKATPSNNSLSHLRVPLFPSSLASALLYLPLLAARRLPFVLSSFMCPR